MNRLDPAILFLDIDGVLLPFPEHTPSSCGAYFPDINLESFAAIVEALPDLLVVLSSTWRVSNKMQQQVLDSFNIYGYTFGGPLASIKGFFDITDPNYHSERQHEIFRWLSQHNAIERAWVALDDEELLGGKANAKYRSHFEGHVVRTHSQLGLTMENANEAILLLRNQIFQARK